MFLALLLASCDDNAVRLRDRPTRPRDTDPAPDTSDPGDTHTGDTDTGDLPVDRGVCGDGVASGLEECDGADDGACPGRCASICACPSAPASDHFTLHMIDVGQGDGLLMVTPDGFTALVDAGDDGTYPVLWNYVDDLGVGLDVVFTSHFHADHMGAMAEVLVDHPEITHAFDSGGRYDSDAFDQYDRRAGDRRTTVEAGDTVDLGPAVQIDVLHAHAGDTDNENNNSVVLRVTHGDVRFLLGGDCEAPVCEDALDPGPIDVYKVHHHGSWNGSSGLLLGRMEPKTALVSVGADNDYGHPTEETLARLVDMGATVWRTDEEGPIVVRSDGAGWETNGVREQ